MREIVIYWDVVEGLYKCHEAPGRGYLARDLDESLRILLEKCPHLPPAEEWELDMDALVVQIPAEQDENP